MVLKGYQLDWYYRTRMEKAAHLWVGPGVGAFVGDLVGALVGSGVCASVGDLVGFGVGSLEGDPGVTVGPAVGALVGLCS